MQVGNSDEEQLVSPPHDNKVDDVHIDNNSGNRQGQS